MKDKFVRPRRSLIELHPCRIRLGAFLALVWRNGLIIQVVGGASANAALESAMAWDATHEVTA